MRTELERWLAEASVPDHDARDVVLASWEAGANAIEHAQAPDGSSFHFDAVLAGDRIRVEVADEGRWKEPSPRENRGLGLRLIEALMTSVDVDRRESGTRVVMERPLSREPARSHGNDSRIATVTTEEVRWSAGGAARGRGRQARRRAGPRASRSPRGGRASS